jgi:hypothetical protein
MRPCKAFTTGLLSLLLPLAWQTATFAQTSAAPAAAAPAQNATPPPSAPAQRSAAELEKLVGPIALYPDPLLATLLPASAYPLEIVQAARFVKDTNNVPKLDTQKWDDNVKAIARFPTVIAQMNDNIAWTSDLGDAFINQPKDVMDAIQTMRKKAQESGALKTTPQQVVTVTNSVVTNTVQQQIVYVTNQVVQIEPAQSQVIYVPQYNPTVVYAGYVAYPGYYYPPPPPYGSVAAASVVSFGVGMAVGAIVANNCDWGHGGCWHSDVNVNRNVNINTSANVNRTANANVNRGQKWQPDANRLRNSGSTASSAQTREARGYPSGSAQSAAATPRASAASSRASPTGPAADRASSPNANRAASSPNANRAPSQSSSQPRASQQASAFSGGGASQTRAASSRGASSRGGGGRRR